MTRALLKTRNWFFEWRGRRFGYEQNRVHLLTTGEAYLDRFIVYFGGPCVRLHRFWRGDDDRAVHDHPWDFWTFPLTDYLERLEDGSLQIVRKFRLHYRPAEYKHFVIGPVRPDWLELTKVPVWAALRDHDPFWTIVFAGFRRRKWGFWPDPNTFIYWRDWR